MKIMIATDAWRPQVNGVVSTISTVKREVEAMGHEVKVVSPDLFRTVPCPTYPEIRLAMNSGRSFSRITEAFDPDAIHISTEGPLGLTARNFCLERGFSFTTSFHTRFPEYVQARLGTPPRWTYSMIRWFHRPSSAVMVAASSLKEELESKGFKRLVRWSRGVDTELFRPRDRDFLPGPRPIFMYVGRVAVEKNIRAFLELELPGTKYVVGDGPQLDELRQNYPSVKFVGSHRGETLAKYYAAADVVVFPSRTDTFGLVVLEAMASGVPVAAYPVTGPKDIIEGSGAGALDEDLKRAAIKALNINPENCRNHALRYSWEECARQFLSHLVSAKNGGRSRS